MFSISINLCFIIILAPLIGSILIGLFGTSFLKYQMGRNSSHLIAILGILISNIGSLIVLIDVISGNQYDFPVYTWNIINNTQLNVGFLIDQLSAIMMFMITFISLMVHIYTIGYMYQDDGYQRFFSYISLFTSSMLVLVMSNGMLQLFFAWEAVGLISYLLIGFWYQKPNAINASLKSFLINRVSDFSFLLGIVLLLSNTQTVHYASIFNYAEKLLFIKVPIIPIISFESTVLNLSCIFLFIGAMGKSAQIPLHVWLPDSMEGPTPVSALIHAATMVTAGIFMVTRFSPLFELSEITLSIMIIIGSIGILLFGILGIVQTDIKRIIAYSTLSQLGYMTVALGSSAYAISIFHLITHAFFKALLFLSAGSVITGMNHNQDIRKMNGLKEYMPFTWFTFLLATLSLVGMPLFSGFYSKEYIIKAAHEAIVPGAGFAYYSTLIGVFITSLYSFRLYFSIFHKSVDKPIHIKQNLKYGNQPKESSWSIIFPLLILAIPSVLIGMLIIEPILFGNFFNKIIYTSPTHIKMDRFKFEWNGQVIFLLHAFKELPFWLIISGAFIAWYHCIINAKYTYFVQNNLSFLYKILINKYYIDWVYEEIIVRNIIKLGEFLWKTVDSILIDGLLVKSSVKIVNCLAKFCQNLQSGYIYHYAFAMIIGLVSFLTIFSITYR